MCSESGIFTIDNMPSVFAQLSIFDAMIASSLGEGRCNP